VRLQDAGGGARVEMQRGGLVRALNVKGRLEILGRGEDLELENIEGGVAVNGYYSGDLTCRNLARPLLLQSGTTELRAEQVSGQLRLNLSGLTATGIAGPVRFKARSRDIRLTDIRGEIELELDEGDIFLAPRRSPTGRIRAATRSGDIEVALPAGSRLQLEAVTRRGGIDNLFGAPFEVSEEGGQAWLKGDAGAGPQVTLSTGRGRITLRKE